MREEFEKLVAAGKIQRHHLEPLLELAQCGYCTHRSWGFGKITTVDTVFSRFSIDFESKEGHTMDLSFAAESLKPIPSTHILARKASDLQSLREMAAISHLELIKLVLESYGGKATAEQIQQVLVPDVIADDWKKWWEVARKEMKKSGHFQLPIKKSDPILYREEEVPLHEQLLGDFRAAKGLKAKLSFGSELLKSISDVSNPKDASREVISSLNADIQTHVKTMPALALEAMFIRDELRQAAGLEAEEGELKEKDIWEQKVLLADILDAMPAAKYRRTLQSFKEHNPETWIDALLGNMNSVPAKLCSEFAHLLIQNGHLDRLKEYLEMLISQHSASSELLLWLSKERSDTYADILGPEVFLAMLTAMERDQFNEKKSNRLGDYILSDQKLLIDLIGSADLDVIRDLTRALKFSTSFDDMDKRSLLARIVKHYPSIQSMISGDQGGKQESGLIVSWESLERRRKEYYDLVHKKIPANSKEIAIARSYGDLRENHEYKAAKEMQKLLMKQKAELEVALTKARGTDFSNASTDTVGVGNHITMTDLDHNTSEQYTILGAWDFDAEKNHISYLTPMAQALLGKKVGDTVEVEREGQLKKYRLDAIEPFKTEATVR